MRSRFLILACLLAASWVSGEKDVSPTAVPLEDMPTDVPNHPNPKRLVIAQPTEPMRRNVTPVQEVSQTKTEAKVESAVMKPMQVTGFITANGSIYEVEDKNGMGQIEARQNGELLTPQPGEYICNYGSVVLYSDMPCEQVAEAQKPVAMDPKEQKETMEKPVKIMNKEKETSTVDIQADDSTEGVEHKENDNDVNASVVNGGNPKKKSKKPGRKGGMKKKKNKKQSNRRNPNNRQYVVIRTVYRMKNPQGQQASQQQLQQQQPLQQPLQQAVQQPLQQAVQQQQQQQLPQRQSQRRPLTANNRRRQQQQIRRILQLEQQRRRRLQQQNPANLERRNKQRYLSSDGILYEIIHVNEN